MNATFGKQWLRLVMLTVGFLALAEPSVGEDKPAGKVRGQPIKPLTTKSDGTPAPAATNAVAKAPVLAETMDGDFLTVGFEKLSSFNYEVPDETPEAKKSEAEQKPQADQIPKTVRSLDKKRVALKGFMLPLKVEGGLITELLIMRDQSMCCYGSVPKINEWVSVKMTGKGVKPIMDQAVTLYGKLYVGEIRENGYLVGIYQMDGEKMAGPLDL